MDLIQFQNNLRSINVNDLIDDTVIETGDKIINHNRMQMLFGKSTEGDDLGHYVYDWYAEDKANYFADYHAPYGVYNFSLNGDFQDRMYVRPLLTAIEIGSTDSKTGYLEKLAGLGDAKKGGERTFGLTDPNLETYSQQEFAPVFRRKLKTGILK